MGCVGYKCVLSVGVMGMGVVDCSLEWLHVFWFCWGRGSLNDFFGGGVPLGHHLEGLS